MRSLATLIGGFLTCLVQCHSNATVAVPDTSYLYNLPDSQAQQIHVPSELVLNMTYDGQLITDLSIYRGDNDQTSITKLFNSAIWVGDKGVYTGGKGILVRNPFDGYEQKTDWQVVPATFLVNDIITPTSVFPTAWNGWEHGNGNPDCPNPGTNGYKKMPPCPSDPRTGDDGPWNYATTAYVICSQMTQFFPDFNQIQSDVWGWGVFYPTDANGVDGRCRYLDQYKGYDCPGGWVPWGGEFTKDSSKKGAGAYGPGNPDVHAEWGGGAGCHIGLGGTVIDQTPVDKPGISLVLDQNCQCNYVFRDDWSHLVKTWIYHAHNRKQEDGWFAGGKAPGHALDMVSCWVNNPRDMINLQNQFYWNRYSWANQISPTSKWVNSDPTSLRPYWGWNEVPISRVLASEEKLRDAVMIKLPPAVCGKDGGHDSLQCLQKGYGQNLEGDLSLWLKNGILKTGVQNIGNRPGSYVVIMREWYTLSSSGSDNWSKWFFCENWQSPSGTYKVVFIQPSTTNPTGACYLDNGQFQHGLDVVV